MTDSEILKSAIEKAQKNGLDYGKIYNFDEIASIIFSHDFAEAFFDDKLWYPPEIVTDKNISCWQYHLQQMVLEPEPLKYLEKFL